jgi:hypothetical protein
MFSPRLHRQRARRRLRTPEGRLLQGRRRGRVQSRRRDRGPREELRPAGPRRLADRVNGPAIPEAAAAAAGSRALPDDRIRIFAGRSDVGVLAALNRLTGLNCSASPCVGADGSGYYVVQHSEVADGVADHSWWQSVNLGVPTNSCTWSPTFDPGFPPPSGPPWSLTTSLNWLRATLD